MDEPSNNWMTDDRLMHLIYSVTPEPTTWFYPEKIADPVWAVGVSSIDPSTEPGAGALTRELGPYDACVPASIAALAPVLDHRAYSEVAEASTLLGRYYTETQPNTAAVARLAALTEAICSSAMEGIRATVTDVALLLADPRPARRAGDDTSLVADHFSSVVAASQSDFTETTSTDLSHRLHSTLLTRSVPEIAGKVRNCPVWIGSGYGRTPHSAVFVPPSSKIVEAGLEDLDQWSQRPDVAPVVQAAVAHAQFETIHPYADGNGRVGRTLVNAWLRRSGAIEGPVVAPISWGLSRNRSRYIDALIDYRYGDIAPIVSITSDALIAGAYFTASLSAGLVDVRARWASELTARPDAVAWKILDTALAGHVVNANDLAYTLEVSYPTANAAIAQLVDIGALTLVGEQRRNRSFIATEVTELVSDLMFPRRGSR